VSAQEFSRSFIHKKKRYRAVFKSRPFREGLEVSVAVGEKVIRIGDLGLGVEAAIQKLRAEIDKIFGIE